MQQGISSHVFLPRRLNPALLDTLAQAGASAIEIFAARHHFDYTDRAAVLELANWFRSNNVAATLHMPLYPDAEWSPYITPSLSLIDSSKAARIDAQDEVKRALEAAEQVPFRTCVIHLGLSNDPWDSRSLDDSLTAIEHLKAFASPLGVKLLLENLTNDVATPEHLTDIVRIGHFSDIGFCLDTGHANITSHNGMTEAFEFFGDKLAELHLHDNHGTRDEHLWPITPKEANTIDWPTVAERIAALKTSPTGIFEISHDLGENEKAVATNAATAFRIFKPE